jgi:hypothetical protein
MLTNELFNTLYWTYIDLNLLLPTKKLSKNFLLIILSSFLFEITSSQFIPSE